MTGSILGPLAALAAVIALIPLALWLFKRTPLGQAASTSGMRVVAALPLAPNQRVVTVEVGTGDERRWLVLGVTPGSIRTLHSLPPQAPAGVESGAMAPFARLLARHRSGDTGDSNAS